MATDVIDMYQQTIKPMPAAKRFRLAKLILDDLPSESVGEFSWDWTEEDLREASLYSLRRAGKSMGEED